MSSCAICLAEISGEPPYVLQGCSHGFHKACIAVVVKLGPRNDPRCSICRGTIAEPDKSRLLQYGFLLERAALELDFFAQPLFVRRNSRFRWFAQNAACLHYRATLGPQAASQPHPPIRDIRRHPPWTARRFCLFLFQFCRYSMGRRSQVLSFMRENHPECDSEVCNPTSCLRQRVLANVRFPNPGIQNYLLWDPPYGRWYRSPRRVGA